MFNNITSTLLSGDSSEKLIWTLCSVLCGSCLISTIVLQISSLLGHKSLAKYLATSSRYIWYWCIGQLSVYSLACVAGGLSGEREKRCENSRITKTRAKPAFSALYSSRLCRSFARSTSKTASYTGYNFDEINEKFRPLPSSPTTPPPPHPKSKMGKWRVLPFAQLHPWFGVDWGCCSNLFCQDCNLSDFSENNKLNGYARAFNPLNPHRCSA